MHKDPNTNLPSRVSTNATLRPWQKDDPKKWRIPTNFRTTTSDAHWRHFCRALDTWHDPEDNIIVTLPLKSDIRVGYLNVNGLLEKKVYYILWFYNHQELDVLFLIDTRLSVESGFHMKGAMHERLGNEFLILQSATRVVPGYGGQLAIIRPHLKRHFITEETDLAKLGVLFALTFRHGLRTLTIASVYWPNNHTGPESVWTRLREYMTSCNQPGSVTAYCTRLVQNVVDRTMTEPSNTCVVGGDWNVNWQDSRQHERQSHTSIAHWAQETGLHNTLSPLLPVGFKTRYPTTSLLQPPQRPSLKLR